MDGSHFGGTRDTGAGRLPAPWTTPNPVPDPLPDREWSLSAGQVVAAVLVIVAVCELIGVMG